MNITITITEDENRVLESWLGVGVAQTWLQHAIDNKIRQRMDASIKEHTDRNPKKLTYNEKVILLNSAQLPTRAERDGGPVNGK